MGGGRKRLKVVRNKDLVTRDEGGFGRPGDRPLGPLGEGTFVDGDPDLGPLGSPGAELRGTRR